jgi:hypothetical protein
VSGYAPAVPKLSRPAHRSALAEEGGLGPMEPDREPLGPGPALRWSLRPAEISPESLLGESAQRVGWKDEDGPISEGDSLPPLRAQLR